MKCEKCGGEIFDIIDEEYPIFECDDCGERRFED